jgi:hypothetical protein
VSFHPGESRVDALLRAVLPKLPTFLPESFTSILFSLACLGCRPGEPRPTPACFLCRCRAASSAAGLRGLAWRRVRCLRLSRGFVQAGPGGVSEGTRRDACCACRAVLRCAVQATAC